MANANFPPLAQLVGAQPVEHVSVDDMLDSGKLKLEPKVDKKPVRQQVLRIKGTKDTTGRVLAALNKHRGTSGAVSSYSRSSDSVISAVKYVIKTGIPSLDAATGGIPFSKVVELYGLDMCGKTATAMLICGCASQGEIYEVMPDESIKKLDVPFEVTILYLDNENSLDEGDRLMVYDQEVDCIAGECDTIDQIFKDIETACEAIAAIQVADAKKALESKKAKEEPPFIAPLQFLVVVVDTIAGTSTREELKQDWAKVDYKRQPAQLREGFRNTIRRLKEQNVCAIFTNQVGDSFKPKPKGMAANKTMLPQESDFSSFGGKALKYYAHLRIFVCKTPYPYKLAPGMFPDGVVIHFFTAKNRFKMPLRSGRMVLMFKNALCQDPKEWVQVIRPARIADIVAREQDKGNKKFTAEDAEKLFPINPPGGLSPIWSVLEHLVYMRFIDKTATKGYRVNFAKHGVKTEKRVTIDLQELDDSPGLPTPEYELSSKLEWPPFYKEHKAEIDVLFNKSVEKMFAQNGVDIAAEADEMDLDSDLVDPDSTE